MQLLSPHFTGNTAKETVVANSEGRTQGLSGLPSSGFQSVLSQYSTRSDQAGGLARAPAVSDQGKTPVSASTGQMLPLRQTTDFPLTPAAEVLDSLDGLLDDLTGTVENILALEQNGPAGETGPATRFLVEDMGFTEAEATDLIDMLEAWVADPPQVAMTPESLTELGSEALALVRAMEDSLASLDQDLNLWFQKIAEMTVTAEEGSDENTVGPVAGNTSQPESNGLLAAPARERSMLETLQQWSQALSEGQGGLSQVIASIAERVKLSLNSTANSGLPASFDQTRPEAMLLNGEKVLGEKSAPSADTLFSQLLQNGSTRTDTDQETSALSRLTPLAAAVADDAGLSSFSGQPVLDKTDAVSAVIQRSLQQPMLASDAGRQLGERLALMVKGDVQHATIRLDPPELGLMDVRISVQNDQTQVQIVVQSPQVREALESQSVRLREFLEQQGLSLAKLDIRDGSADQQQAGGDQSDRSGNNGSGLGNGEDDTLENTDPATNWEQGLVDHFV
jgi:flagellar hook-length control protein FliK